MNPENKDSKPIYKIVIWIKITLISFFMHALGGVFSLFIVFLIFMALVPLYAPFNEFFSDWKAKRNNEEIFSRLSMGNGFGEKIFLYRHYKLWETFRAPLDYHSVGHSDDPYLQQSMKLRLAKPELFIGVRGLISNVICTQGLVGAVGKDGDYKGFEEKYFISYTISFLDKANPPIQKTDSHSPLFDGKCRRVFNDWDTEKI